MRCGGGQKYADILNLFAPKVCCSENWEKHKAMDTISDMVLPLLKAFFILVMENFAAHQKYKYDRENGVNSGMLPARKYTNQSSEEMVNGHWNLNGMIRFKELCDKVTKDRESEEGKQVEREFLERMKKNCREWCKMKEEGRAHFWFEGKGSV